MHAKMFGRVSYLMLLLVFSVPALAADLTLNVNGQCINH